MNEEQKTKFIFPEEYRHIEKDINQVTENLKAIDYQIKNAVDDPINHPTLDYRPPATPPIYKQRLTKEQKKELLKNQKEHVKSEAWTRTETALKNIDPEIASGIQSFARNSFSDYKDMTVEQLKAEQHADRSIDNAQDYIEAKPSLSSRFSQTLGYTQEERKVNDPTLGKGPEKGKDDPDKGR